MSWMFLSLGAATLVGLVGSGLFREGLADDQTVFVKMVQIHFSPFWVGIILCAILAATINCMSSQILVLSTTLVEDFYKKLLRKDASPKELLHISRLSVLLVGLLAFAIAWGKIGTIYALVHYAWSGLGSSFGPILIAALFAKNVNRYGAYFGIISGGIVSALWPLLPQSSFKIDPMIPAFAVSFLAIWLGSLKRRTQIA
jgi:sodium/proline symporter